MTLTLSSETYRKEAKRQLSVYSCAALICRPADREFKNVDERGLEQGVFRERGAWAWLFERVADLTIRGGQWHQAAACCG